MIGQGLEEIEKYWERSWIYVIMAANRILGFVFMFGRFQNKQMKSRGSDRLFLWLCKGLNISPFPRTRKPALSRLTKQQKPSNFFYFPPFKSHPAKTFAQPFPFPIIIPSRVLPLPRSPSLVFTLLGLLNIIQYLIIQIFDQLPEMADKDTKKEGVEDTELKRTRITFSGNKLNAVQQVTNQLVGNAKTQGVKISGPVRLPNKHLRICCRRSPCGEGSKTWDNWEMTIYKRYIDLECTTGQMKEVTSITIPNGIEISVDFRTAA